MTASAPEPVRTVVAATDFSSTAARALQQAAELAHERGARLVLVHVTGLQPFSLGGPRPAALPPDFESAVREAAQKRLDAAAAEVPVEGLEMETVLENGTPSERLVEVAEREHADLVVLGTRGLSGLRHLLLGSTASAVVRGAPCPVLTVHPGDEVSLRDLRTVVVPTDFSEDADHAVDELGRLFGPHARGARVVLLHVYHLPLLLEPLFGDVRVIPASFDEISGQLREDLEPAAERLRAAGFEVDVDVREGDPSAVVVQRAEDLGADLVAMGTRGRSGLRHVLLGSTAERVVQHASCPVLSVRRP